MKNRIEIIRKSRSPKITQEQLADACNTTKQTIGRLANGKQPLTVEWMEKIAAALGCEPYELLTEASSAQQKSQIASPQKQNGHNTEINFVDVYGPASASSQGIVKFTEEHIVEREERPIELKNIKDGFRMFVAGDSMEPRHFHGEKVSVHPNKYPATGQDCVIVMEPDGNAIIKRYIGRTDSGDYRVMQWNPKKDLIIKKKDVRAIYTVVR